MLNWRRINNHRKHLSWILRTLADVIWPPYIKITWYDGYSEGVATMRRRYSEEIKKMTETIRKLHGMRPDQLRNRRVMTEMHRRRYLRELALKPKTKCLYCRKRLATTIDHIVPLSHNGTWDRANIAPACEICNKAKGSQTLAEFLVKI